MRQLADGDDTATTAEDVREEQAAEETTDPFELSEDPETDEFNDQRECDGENETLECERPEPETHESYKRCAYGSHVKYHGKRAYAEGFGEQDYNPYQDEPQNSPDEQTAAETAPAPETSRQRQNRTRQSRDTAARAAEPAAATSRTSSSRTAGGSLRRVLSDRRLRLFTGVILMLLALYRRRGPWRVCRRVL